MNISTISTTPTDVSSFKLINLPDKLFRDTIGQENPNTETIRDAKDNKCPDMLKLER